MLAAVLVLTIVPVWVKIGRAVVEHSCFLISQKLLDADEVSSILVLMASSSFNLNVLHLSGPGMPNGSPLRQDIDISVLLWQSNAKTMYAASHPRLDRICSEDGSTYT